MTKKVVNSVNFCSEVYTSCPKFEIRGVQVLREEKNRFGSKLVNLGYPFTGIGSLPIFYRKLAIFKTCFSKTGVI